MIRPVDFGYNAETAVNNAFQVRTEATDTQARALWEFNLFVDLLRTNGVDVTVVEDTAAPHTPDSIFPNNWVSFHSDGSLILYPMYAPNRRAERKQHVLDTIKTKFDVRHQVDLSGFENRDIFLEGTGSMVLDRENKIAYACLSPRTSETGVAVFCEKMQYRPCTFQAFDSGDRPIYHTNVMMCVADRFAVICLEAIKDRNEAKKVRETIASSGKEVIEISLDQMSHFAGNMLQVENGDGEKLLVMSTQAFEALSKEQVAQLGQYNRVLHSPLTTIEATGGGSARCMMAEVHLPARSNTEK